MMSANRCKVYAYFVSKMKEKENINANGEV
jgi:hypothetical protein